MSYQAALLTVTEDVTPGEGHRELVDSVQTRLARHEGSLVMEREAEEDKQQIIDSVAEVAGDADVHALIVVVENPERYELVFEALEEADFDTELEAADQLRRALMEAAPEADEDNVMATQIQGTLVFTLPGELVELEMMIDYLAPLLSDLVNTFA